ncbi:hypothetical protein AN931_22975 [Mycobacterium intracellulare subsp. chimaera]|uniref:YbaB/EbfC family DNA-binding protein n=1 Tax=Mycobacterium intracellulare TaxID=1767 RepID=A0AAE4RF45_MYCIT|nr:hypothetical protein [Mycobacterium intracellulare]KPN48854.1 hypothetical protein AN931_22975 [Mycobacterium intracellulare subsp. chimaera]KPN50970.1 hypothetical protein AN933_20605 [Mycobacterium intracellulare subsp. chimaera]MDM3908816.1 hypothetical protein [Mycobacterium intracellulare subsp. chimaera]MDV6979134.1 hypothetical protein [Mycobacterium intracellulare]MDV6984542.1 hypothetical protein [Mycobacterium intracellulare]
MSTPQERIAAVDQGLRMTRAMLAELNDASRNVGHQDPISDVVIASFDRDGYLSDLFIEPAALADYTHTELEDLITEVLRDGNERLREASLAIMDRYWGPESSWHELKVLRDEW